MSQPIWNTPAGSIGQFKELRPIAFQFNAISADGLSNVVYTLQSGRFPSSLPEAPITLRPDGYLYGTPAEVATDTTYGITIRATDSFGNIRDRAFTLTVVGASPPRFLTYPGTIITTVDSTYVHYQVQYENTDPQSVAEVTIISGELPLGLEMSITGLITGYAEPPLNIYGQPTSTNYPFTLQLSSGSGIAIINYNITVINYYVQNPIPSDNARLPVLLNSQPLSTVIPPTNPYYGYYTPYDGNIGRVRHDNEWVFKLAGYDFENAGSLSYNITNLQAINQSNMVTPGTLAIDHDTGWITGKFPNIGNRVLDFYLSATVIKTVPSGYVTGNIIGIASFTIIGSITRVTTITPHNFFNGQQITLDSCIPTTINSTTIYAKVINSTTFEMYQNQALTSPWPNPPITVTTRGVCWANQYDRTSQVYRFTLTLVGDLDNDFTWVTPTNLGIINNGCISNFTIEAETNLVGETVNYRIVNENRKNLNSVVNSVVGGVSATSVPSYYAVGDLGEIAYSDNYGRTWNYLNQFTFDNLTSIAAGYYPTVSTGTLVTVGYTQSSQPSIYGSNDGINWSPASTAGNSALYSVMFDNRSGGERFIAVGDDATILTSSQSGFVWTQGTITVTGSTSTDVNYVFRKLIRTGSTSPYTYTVVGNKSDNTGAIYYSNAVGFPVGGTWSAATVNTIAMSNVTQATIAVVTTSTAHNMSDGQRITISGVVGMTALNGNNYYVKATGYHTNTFALYTNVTLTTPVNSSAYSAYVSGGTITLTIPALRSIATNGSKWIAVGEEGYVLESSNGTTWSLQKAFTTERLNDIIYESNQFFVVGDDGFTAYSENGDNNSWSYLSGNTGNDLYSITLGLTRPNAGVLITNITQTGTAVVTVVNAHQFTDADRVCIVDVLGMTEINDQQFYVKVLTINTFELYTDVSLTTPFSTLSYSNYISGGSAQKVEYNFVAVGQYGTVVNSRYILIYNPEAITDEYDEFNYDLTFYDQNAKYVIEWTSPTLGQLPPNLVMLSSGEISGRLAFEATDDQNGVYPYSSRVYYFTVQAYIVGQEEISETKEFYFTAVQEFPTPWETVYMQCYPNLTTRAKINDLIRNSTPGNPNLIIPDAAVYRINDPYYGRAKNIIYNHAYGIPANTVQEYITALSKNFYWRDITLGEVKTAVARDTNNEIVYEVVYCEIIDNLVNNAGVSIPKEIGWPRNINLNLGQWYDSNSSTYTSYVYSTSPISVTISSVVNVTTYVVNSVEGLSLNMVLGNTNAVPYITSITPNTYTIVLNQAPAGSYSAGDTLTFYTPSYFTALTPGYVRTLYPNSLDNMRQQLEDVLGYVNNDTILPLWMTSQQINGSTLGYTPAWVICYTKPNYSTTVKNNINAWQTSASGIKVNQVQFTIDRFEVDKSLTFDWNGVEWVSTLPSAQPPVTNNSADQYVYITQKTILPRTLQSG